jgi:hypothetical protein
VISFLSAMWGCCCLPKRLPDLRGKIVEYIKRRGRSSVVENNEELVQKIYGYVRRLEYGAWDAFRARMVGGPRKKGGGLLW